MRVDRLKVPTVGSAVSGESCGEGGEGQVAGAHVLRSSVAREVSGLDPGMGPGSGSRSPQGSARARSATARSRPG